MNGSVDQDASFHTLQGGGVGGGCSAAAAYLSGVIALMQANNPNLDPQNTALTSTQRRAIPADIRNILLSTAAPALVPRTRGPLVNPRAAVDRAAQARVPDFGALGFDTLLNSNEPWADTEMSGYNLGVVPVGWWISQTGTLHHLPGIAATGISGFPGTAVPGRAGVLSADEDWFRATTPSTPGVMYRMRVEVRSLSGFGRPVLTGSGLRSSGGVTVVGQEEIQRFETGTLYPSTLRTFKLSAPNPGDDNVYKVFVTVESVSVMRMADRFDADDANNPPESRPNNNTTGRAPIFGTARTDSFGNQFN
jgi:hypothetical protein